MHVVMFKHLFHILIDCVYIFTIVTLLLNKKRDLEKPTLKQLFKTI